MKYIFLDTNIYLHFQDFEQIPWNEIVKDDAFALVIPDKVVAEIDKVKDGQPGKIKDRAKKISRKFADYLLYEKENRRFKVIPSEDPTMEFLVNNRLDWTKSDHIIIGSILCFNQIEDSVAISHDNGFLMTAKRHGIKFICMPEKYIRANEKSDAEKERDEYKRALEEANNRYPDLKITFDNGSSVLNITRPTLFDIEEMVSAKVNEIKAEHPYLYRQPKEKHETKETPIPIENLVKSDFNSLAKMLRLSIPKIDPLLMVSDERIAEYNQELDEYFEECQEYYHLVYLRKWLQEQMSKLSFKLVNLGTAMSGEMLICLQFPKELSLYNEKCSKKIEIKKPQEPNINFSKKLALLGLSNIYGLQKPTVTLWDLDHTIQKNEFTIRESNLIHGTEMSLDIDYGLFINIKEATEFNIKWAIADSESKEPFSGELLIKISNK